MGIIKSGLRHLNYREASCCCYSTVVIPVTGYLDIPILSPGHSPAAKKGEM